MATRNYTDEEIRYVQSLYRKTYYWNLCNRPGLGMAPGNVTMHQMIQMRFTKNYLKRFGNNILTETKLSSKIRITPDISIWEKIDFNRGIARNPILTIEITHTRQNDRYSDSTIRMAFDLFPSIMESFIYNYADNTWHRYFRGTDGEAHLKENKDYSKALRCYLHTLLK
ncbi:MAG: hypothetical protein IJJ78_02850 [Paludibacteraceae bacterium]|nr:hypothetical protein [Paludibacteraceae bacterium]MBR0498004.1 hypothetical protein [Paludibacteraceae bacterium]